MIDSEQKLLLQGTALETLNADLELRVAERTSDAAPGCGATFYFTLQEKSPSTSAPGIVEILPVKRTRTGLDFALAPEGKIENEPTQKKR